MAENTKPVQMGEAPARGWCIVASGLCIDKTRIVIKSGFAMKEEADEASQRTASEPAGMGTRAAREPRRCKVVRVRAAENGLLEPLETIEGKAAWEDALRLTEQDSDARIAYPAWTFGKKVAAGVAAVTLVAAVGCGVALAAGRPPRSRRTRLRPPRRPRPPRLSGRPRRARSCSRSRPRARRPGPQRPRSWRPARAAMRS